MVEIVGFNEAYKNCLAAQAKKDARKKMEKRKIDELIKQGVDKQIASAMVKALFDVGIYD